MPVFKYKALTKDKKAASGLVEAPSEDLAIETLKERGLGILAIKKKVGISKEKLLFFNRIKARDLVIFSRQFAVLVSANMALAQSLKMLIEQTANPKFKAIVSEIADEVDAGAKLSDSLSKRPKIFSDFFVNVVRAGETSGKLDEVLNYLADELEKDYDMMGKIKGAMIYPAFVMGGMGVVGIVMMVFVVPKLLDVMRQTGGELPMATKILIGVSDLLVNRWWLLLIILAGLFLGLKYLTKAPIIKRWIDNLILVLPVFGKLFQRIYLVRFTRSLQTLIVGGVDISRGLKITSEVITNHVYRTLIKETKKEVEDGNSISTVFVNSKKVPTMVSQMMSVGEKTGRLDTMLSHVTDFYTREINGMVSNLMTLMEPIIMVIIGVAVGIMVAAIIMPMYNMASQF